MFVMETIRFLNKMLINNIELSMRLNTICCFLKNTFLKNSAYTAIPIIPKKRKISTISNSTRTLLKSIPPMK